jgi:alanine racemase
MSLRPTRAIVDLDALGRNYRELARRVGPSCSVMPVVKADAYGHGSGVVASRLVREGASSFAVAVVEEGIELRRAGIRAEILVMGWIGSAQLPDLVRHGLVANAHSIPQLTELVEFAESRRVRIPLHVKLDTGMTRLGVTLEDLSDVVALLRRGEPWLVVEGVFQNFASADEPDGEQTPAQVRRFREMTSALREMGVDASGVHVHVSNSAGTLAPPGWSGDLPSPARARPGLALYTRFPGLSGEEFSDVMTFASVVDQVKEIEPGTRVGYGGTFVAKRRTRIAIVPGGYADGVPRSLSGAGSVLIRGTRCAIAGRISMDLTAVDVTDLESAPVRGDDVVFFGSQGNERLGVEELARAAGTVAWEVLCGVGPRVPRVIMEGGVPVRVLSRFLPAKEAAFE